MELKMFSVLLGVVIGALAGKGKGVVKSLAKGYLAVEEKAMAVTGSLREDIRDAVEEARYDREQTALLREQAAATQEEAPQGVGQPVAASPASPKQPRAKTSPRTSPRAGGTGGNTPPPTQ